jgi:hypothetical protein
MPRISTVATEKVRAPHWDAEDYVTLRTAPSGFDLEAVSGARLAWTQGDGATATPAQMVFTPQAQNTAKLEAAVVGGTFRDENGRVLPYAPELLKSLSPDDRAYLVGEIDRLWAPWLRPSTAQTPEEQKKEDFRNGQDVPAGPGGETPSGAGAA